MTVQELIDQLDNYEPGQSVKLAVTHEGDGSSVTQVYEIASVAASNSDANDVHLAAGAQVVC
jgi:NAD(P)H-flavin reductase